MVRKIFEEKIQAPKKHAEIAGKFIDDPARDEANELQDIKKKRLNTEKILQEEEEENNKLKATIEKLIGIREENAKKKLHNKSNRPSKPNSPNRLYRLT
jgi:hypothetical protein